VTQASAQCDVDVTELFGIRILATRPPRRSDSAFELNSNELAKIGEI